MAPRRLSAIFAVHQTGHLMAKIASTRARTVHIPLREATAFARREVTARDYALVSVLTDDGLRGLATATPDTPVGM